MDEQIQSSLSLTLLQYVCSYLSFTLTAIQFFYLIMGKKLWRHISFPSTCFCYYMKHPNNDVIRFVRYHLLLALNRNLQTVSQYLGIIQICWNLNEHHYYLNSTKSVIFQDEANCFSFQSLDLLSFHIRLERFKLMYYSLISNFSKYYFTTSTFGVLFFSSHIFTA